MVKRIPDRGTAGTVSGDTVYGMLDDYDANFTELYDQVAALAASTGNQLRSGSGAPSDALGTNGDFYINSTAKTLYGPKSGGTWGSATNIIGPQGVKGDTGDPGADGAPGAPGTDGKTIHPTSGTPSGALGVNGDYAMDVAAGNLYGPKASGTWPAARSLIGPQGPQGDPGTGGEGGGNVLRSGSGAPSGALGINGDFYIDTAADTLYGPKTAGAWGSPTSLVGPSGADGDDGAPGAPGADGKTIRSGSGVPSNGLGVDGDWYINTALNTIHGPKAAGVWPAGVSLVGPEGPQGDPGADGAPGDDGAAGADGRTILSTTGAPSGALGVDGDYAIDTAAGNLYGPKSGGTWPAARSLVGPQGDPGADGSDGAPGAPGADGKTVRNGTSVPSGALGVDGDFYIKTDTSQIYGPKTSGAWGSPVSLVGPQGTAGAAGRTILNGTAAPTGGVGADGDFYIRTSDSTLYGPKASGTWPAPVSLVGPQGNAGTPGADGKTVRNGAGAPAGGLGVDGDFYIDTTADAIYGPKAGGAWGSPTSLIGPQGPQGDPGGGGGITVNKLASDVVVSTGGANALNDITGLSFDVVAGTAYYFRFVIMHVSSVTTTGARFSINGPAFTLLGYRSSWPLTATTEQNNPGLVAYDQPATAGATALADEQVAIIEGIIVPSASGTVVARMAREVNSGSVTAKAGSMVMVS